MLGTGKKAEERKNHKTASTYHNWADIFSHKELSFIAQAEIDTLKLVRDLFITSGTQWSIPSQENLDRFKLLLQNLSKIWNSPTNIILDIANTRLRLLTGGGRYIIHSNTITLYKLSLTTALHEWKHRLQATIPKYSLPDSNPELDAQVWACTVVYNVAPKLFIQNYKNKTIFYASYTFEVLTGFPMVYKYLDTIEKKDRGQAEIAKPTKRYTGDMPYKF